MIWRRRVDAVDEVESTSPWAGDDIEISDAPAEFDWAAAGVASTDDAEPGAGQGNGPSGRASDRRTTWIGVAAGVVIVVAAAALLWPSDDPADDSDAADAEETPTTLASLPDPTDETVDDVTTTATNGGEDDTENQGDNDDDSLLAPIDGDGDGDQRPTSIDLPAALAATTAPTEVVLATRAGIATLSLPSGRLRYSTNEIDAAGGNLVVSPDAAAYSTNGASGDTSIAIVPRVGPAFEVSVPDHEGGAFVRGWRVGPDGGTTFVVQTFGPDGDRVILVGLTGEITALDPAQSVTGFSTFDYARTTELNIVNDAGGVYRYGPDGTATRIATGRAFAANGDHLLLRECDETLACDLVVQDFVTGDRTVVDPELDIASVFGLDLAPDGTAFTALSAQGETDTESVRIVDLITGEVTPGGIPGPTFFSQGSLWLADSSGIVQSAVDGMGLSFLDRATGSEVGFGDSLGRIHSIGVRYPDAELAAQPGPVVDSTIELSGELEQRTGLDLVVLGSLGTMARLDLDDGSAVAWSVPELADGRGIDLFHFRDTVTAMDARAAFVSTVGTVRSIDTDTFDLPTSPRLPGPAQGLVWAQQPDAIDDAVDHRLRPVNPELPAIDGSGVTIPQARLLGGDGRGGLAVEAPGGVYSVTSSETTQLTTGTLLAIGPNHALARECDAALVCRTLLYDRATGRRSTEVRSRDVGSAIRTDTTPIRAGDDEPVAGTLSPDGTIALTRVSDPDAASGWVLSDFTTGSWQAIPAPVDRQPLIWSDDGSVLAYLSEVGVRIYEPSSGRMVRVDGLGEVSGIVRVSDEFVVPEPVITPDDG